MRIQQVVFDFGGVLIEWNPETIAKMCTSDIELRHVIKKDILQHSDWLRLDKGELSEQEAADLISVRTSLSKEMILSVFDTVRQSFMPLDNTIGVLKTLSEMGVDCYGLSNMSKENYHYLKETYNFFGYFNGEIISGLENVIKPDLKVFKILCERFGLKPEETLFIDDMHVNCEAAEYLGMRSLQFERHKFNLSVVEEKLNNIVLDSTLDT